MSKSYNLQPNQAPYFIVVSNEGPARNPKPHVSESEAKTEADRLAVEHPGLKFTVFKSIASFETPVSATKVTSYVETTPFGYSYYYRIPEGWPYY
jgi:hypothetical protein